MKLFNGVGETYETYAPSWSVYGFCVFHLLMILFHSQLDSWHRLQIRDLQDKVSCQ